jgi:pyruvate,water dikinase
VGDDGAIDPLHRVSKRATAWTRVNIAEGIPGVSTPLSWSWWDDANERMILGAYLDIGVLARIESVPVADVDERTSAIFYGRPALNVDISRRLADLQPGTSGDALEEHYFGAVRPDAVSSPSRRRYPAIAARLPGQWVALPRRIEHLYALIHGWWKALVAGQQLASEAGARRGFAEASRHFDSIARPHSALALLCGALTQQTASLAAAAGHPEKLLDLLGGYNSVELDAIAELLEVREGRRSLETFLAEHGYQGPMQGEMSSVSWREDASPVEALVESLAAAEANPFAIATARAAARERAEREILAGVGMLRRGLARWLFYEGERMLPAREVGKAALMMALDGARASARSLGRHLAAAGHLEDPEDVFYLTRAELEGAMDARFRQRVALRRAQRARYETLELPESWVGNPEVIEHAGEDAAQQPLSGLGVSPGSAEGRVRVVTDGFDQLEPGEILVCEATDPSYAGYFFVAAGVVTDIGGAMGHGSIVAREVGIPCVVNTRDATRRLRTGDRIRIDGGSGAIEILERAAGD